MTQNATAGSLPELVGRLTDQQDRETYASLISYFRSLPPNDELFQLAELLGLLSLIGQRVPDAVSEVLAELRKQTETSAEYHSQVDQRLSRLPIEIAAGVDVELIAKSMSEAFRQQLTTIGLQDTAALLTVTSKHVSTLSERISAGVRSLELEYRTSSSAISEQLRKLLTASKELREHNAQLVTRERSSVRVWQGMLALLLFLMGGVCGIVLEERETTKAVLSLGSQTKQSQLPPLSGH